MQAVFICSKSTMELCSKYKVNQNYVRNTFKGNILRDIYAAWNLSKYGAISGPYFPAFGVNTERYFGSLRIQSEFWKIRTRKNSVFGHFSRSAMNDCFGCIFWKKTHPFFFFFKKDLFLNTHHAFFFLLLGSHYDLLYYWVKFFIWILSKLFDTGKFPAANFLQCCSFKGTPNVSLMILNYCP